MYHPMEPGQYWPETHYPQVKVFRNQAIEIKIFVAPHLGTLFEKSQPDVWTYAKYGTRDWDVYTFIIRQTEKPEHVEAEIRALNHILNYCCYQVSEETEMTTDAHLAQLAFVSAENPLPAEGYVAAMGHYGLWGYFSEAVTKKLTPETVSCEFITSHMRGANKIIIPQLKASRQDSWMRLYSGGNAVPIFQTFGNCACLSVTSNALDYGGGFTLSPHNIDGHIQQFLIMVGLLRFWQRIRTQIKSSYYGRFS